MRILLAGGGTGGHIYPAISIAQRLREKYPPLEILYAGTATGMEATLVPREGLNFVPLAAGGLVGKGRLDQVRGVLAQARGLGQALGILRRFRPHAVVATGGYATVPVAVAAILRGVPLILQEQNAVPGVANRSLAPFARLVAVAYEEGCRQFSRGARVLVTGNPVRPEVASADRHACRRALGLGDGDAFVLIFMGSRGSATVNQAVQGMLPFLQGRVGLRVLWATGPGHFDAAAAALKAPAGVEGFTVGNLEVRPYLYDMVQALAAADLVVARAGAMTLAELTVRGVPSLLIPSPHVTHHHQERNAALLEAEGAAAVLPEAGLTDGRLAARVLELLADRALLSRMGEASRRLGRPGALDTIVDAVMGIIDPARMSPAPGGSA